MCLVIKEQKKAKIARRNFVVSKYLCPINDKYAKSPFRGFIYELGKEYSVKTGFTVRKSPYRIGQTINIGLHSCVKGKTKPGVGGLRYYAIIPKGASYIIGSRNDIVSNRLIVKKRWKRSKNNKKS